jgi:hypothetical protein
MKISFVILTTGDKLEKLTLSIQSIVKNFERSKDYEIVIVGNNLSEFRSILESNFCKIIEDNKFIEFLGKRRNLGTAQCSGEVVVHMDDDMILSENWKQSFDNFCQINKDWEILGHKILLPDGGRHWDRATYLPNHIMVDYDYQSDTDCFYQTGGFGIYKKSLLDKISWDDSLPYYAMFKGFKYNEDVDFSIRLNQAGKKIFFDKNNTVWHYDHSYESNGFTCNKKNQKTFVEYKCIEFIKSLNNILK